MTDLRAAERLRECAEAIVSGVVKEVTPNSTSYAVTENCRIGLMEAYELATAYLAEHPADSDTPIDADWLRSVGGVEGVAPAGNSYFDFSEPRTESAGEHTFLRLHSPLDCGECMADLFGDGNRGVGITRKWPKTRGDVRALARCLGITLKE